MLGILVVLICCGCAIAAPPSRVAAPGRLIGASETLELSFSTAGRIASIDVRPGQTVAAGAQLAQLECTPERTLLAAERDNAARLAARLRQARNGARQEERAIGTRRVRVARAELTAAQHRYNRLHALAAQGRSIAVSAADLELAKDTVDVATAKLAVAEADYALLDAGSRAEELAALQSEFAAQDKRVRATTGQVARCQLRAPIRGTVLKVIADVGESVSTFVPQPVIVLADLSVRRVRAEIDERDVHRVRLGQSAIVSSESNPSLRARGRIVAMDAQMGRRRTRTNDPADKSDRDVLEVLIDLGTAFGQFPVDYRVTVVLQ